MRFCQVRLEMIRCDSYAVNLSSTSKEGPSMTLAFERTRTVIQTRHPSVSKPSDYCATASVSPT
jgi:hypothetical protein